MTEWGIRWGLVVLLATGATVARADSHAREARQHYVEGTKLYDLGRFDEAIAEYEIAYRLLDDPALLYNIAQAHRLAGHAERAVFFYRSFLRRVPQSESRAEVEGRIDELQKRLDRERAQPGTPAPVDVAPAPATTPSATPPTSPPPPPTVAPPPTMTTPPAAATPTATLVAAPPPPSASVGRTKRIVGFSLAGFGVALVAGGIASSLVAKSDGDAISSESTHMMPYDPSRTSNGKLADALGIALDCLGGAAIVAGVIIAVRGYHHERARSLAGAF